MLAFNFKEIQKYSCRGILVSCTLGYFCKTIFLLILSYFGFSTTIILWKVKTVEDSWIFYVLIFFGLRSDFVYLQDDS